MKTKDFFILSEKEVISLNGCTSEESFEAWRAGYLYAQKQIFDIITNQSFDYDDVISNIEYFCNNGIGVFVDDCAQQFVRDRLGLSVQERG